MKLNIINPSFVEAKKLKPNNESVEASYEPKFYTKSFKGRGPVLQVCSNDGKTINMYAIVIDGKKGTVKLEQRKELLESPLDG